MGYRKHLHNEDRGIGYLKRCLICLRCQGGPYKIKPMAPWLTSKSYLIKGIYQGIILGRCTSDKGKTD